jgi:RNA polymerase sigma-70 factor (ECF subfamily)
MLTTNPNHQLLKQTDYLFPFAITLTHNSEEAKDLIQDTLCRALSNMDKFNSDTNMKAWMYTIMKNIFINKYRRKQKENQIFSTSREMLDHCTDTVVPGSQEENVTMKEIRSCIEKLPEFMKAPFLMHFEGYHYKEIAASMNEPLGTIKSRIHFARKLLQEMLPGYSN